ncbi:hypothetical protein DAMNIGENAA_11560 [Desulforhabdus amnigena]|uniref:Transposase IS116/IS110/IS902 C-terminal domain-containing protein n=1 Tax=Desulforhabdus amnigena TaxID=40218 RepID=A0A9W6FS60_9BACT|nr:hypothetical protein DAMNIGENAA_11560 [Desulforhabdus amnigena]
MIEGGTPLQALEFANSRLKATPEELLDALDGDLTPAHRFVLREILQHIRELEARIARFDTQLLAELESHRWALDLLQTIPGIDAVGAAMLIVEIGLDMEAFGSPQRLASWAGVCPGNNESAGKRKAVAFARAIHMYDDCCAKWLMPYVVPKACSKASIRGLSYAGDTSAPLLLWLIRF